MSMLTIACPLLTMVAIMAFITIGRPQEYKN